MEVILIILTSTIISACFFAIYQLGIHHGKKVAEQNKDKLTINNQNKQWIRERVNFANFNG